MDHKISVTDPYTFYEVDLCVTLIHYPKFDISPSNSLEDMIQNHWTITKITDLHIFDEVNLCVTLIHYTNYDVHTKILSKITRP